MERRIFTVTEANRAIPRVARLVQDLQERYQWLHANRQPVESNPDRLGERFNIVDESPVAPAYFKALLRIRHDLKELNEVGAQVKDIGSGLVDFPARLNGREVLLCWRLGEDRIRFWHDLESGYSGRQPLPNVKDETGSEGEGS